MKSGLILLLLGMSLPAQAYRLSSGESISPVAPDQSYNSLLMGHNLTPTSYTVERGQFVVGVYDIIYGLTDHLMLATCPWLLGIYNMPMVNLKYSFKPVIFNNASFEMMYFKTGKFGMDNYQQKSGWLRFTGTFDLGRAYRIHTAFGAQYFWDDHAPFSMRPPPVNRTPLTLSLSALQEIHFSKHVGIFLESGVLGFNYPNRYAHGGLSAFYEWKRGYVQLGISKTFRIGPQYLQTDVFSYEDYADRSYSHDGRTNTSVYYNIPEPIHPEIHIQFLL